MALRILRHPLVLLAAVAGGVLIGRLAGPVATAIRPAGDLYLFLLQMTVIPIVVSAVVWGVGALVQRRGAARLILRGILVLAALALAAGLIGLVAALVARPGRGQEDEQAAALSRLIQAGAGADTVVTISGPDSARAAPSTLDRLTGVVPRNVFAALSAGTVVPAILFSLLFGLAIGLLGDKRRDHLLGITRTALEALKRVNQWLIYLLPVGVVCLVAYQAATAGTAALRVLSGFLLTLLAALSAAAALLLLVVWRRSGRSLRATVSALVEPLTYAFITGSSLVAIPYSLRALTDKLGYPSEHVDATLPITTVLGRFGYLITFVLAAAFMANSYGITWSPAGYATLLAAAATGSVAAAGAGGAAALGMMSLVLAPVGLPGEPAAIIFSAVVLAISPMVAAFETHAGIAAVTLLVAPESAHTPLTPPHRRFLTLRASIVILIASLIVLTGLVGVGLMYFGQRRNTAYLASRMIADITARVVQRTANYLSPAERAAQILGYLFQQGNVDTEDRESLLAILRNAVVSNPELAAVHYGDEAGGFTTVRRMPDGTLSYRLISRSGEGVRITWKHANPEYAAGFPDSVESLDRGYDPRARGWYRDAVAAGGGVWTDVYLLASDNMLGVSHAVPVYTGRAEDGVSSKAGVVAVDIGLAELSYFLGTLDVSTAGRAYVLNERDQLVALSVPRGSDLSGLFAGQPSGSAASTADLVPADEASDPLVRESFLAHSGRQREEASFTVQIGREGYLAALTAFPSGEVFPWKVGIVLPESDIYGFVNETTRTVLYASLLIILVAIGLGVNFSRAITHPLRTLSRAMERIRNFDLGGQVRVVSKITEIHTMAQSFANMKHGLSAFNKYVPSRLVAELIRLGEEPRIGGQRKRLTILFTGVAGFTRISERVQPERLVEDLAVYFGALGSVIMRNRGTVDKYVGDAIMAFWNAPGDVADHEMEACRSALECQRVLSDLRLRAGHARPLPEGGTVLTSATRMGIHTGEVVVGNMGSDERLSYTCVGDSVNLASRLEGLNRHYGTTIIVSGTTYAAVRDTLAARLVDRVAVKGRSGGIEIYELVGNRDRLPAPTRRFVEIASRGVRSYLDGDFGGAMDLCRRALAIQAGDRAMRIILGRCRTYLGTPPPADWNGVFVHHAK
jgi:adenylate cyclase